MAKTSRSTEIWHIPKRGSLHQTLFMVYLLSQDEFNGKSWTSQKQEKVGTEMGRAGLTKDGRVISHQSVRTLLANMPQYLGFIYKDESVTPTQISITNAGKSLLEEFPLEKILVHNNSGRTYKNNIKTYVENGDFIQQSDVFKHQMMKLIITNPYILNDCKNILLFPFKFTAEVLLEVGYLDIQEIAYILFHAKSESSLRSSIERIKSFRMLPRKNREAEINAYLMSDEGQLTLGKAPSARYYMTMCLSTGLCKLSTRLIENLGKEMVCLELKDENQITEVLEEYKDAKIYNFENNSELWKEYISEPKRKLPPKDIKVFTNSKNEILVTISQNSLLLGGETINKDRSYIFPFFCNEEYLITAYNLNSGEKIFENLININNNTEIEIVDNLEMKVAEHSIQEFGEMILGMFDKSNDGFDSEYQSKLKIIEKVLGKNYFQSVYRGGRLEFLFYKILEELKSRGLIDDVQWNGAVGEYGIPKPAPGGKDGKPDIVFYIGNKAVVLELTTIHAITLQWNAEGSSVPDHIEKFKLKNSANDIIGIFSAPAIYHRVETQLLLNAKHKMIPMNCLRCSELVEKLVGLKSKEDINIWLDELNNIS